MVASPEFDYKELKEVRSFEGISRFRLRVSSAQAASLKRCQRRVSKYQLSEALNDDKHRNILTALPVMLSELWGTIRYPNLGPVRGLFIGGEVESVHYEREESGEVVMHSTLRQGAS